MKQKFDYKVVRVVASRKSIGTSKQKPSGEEAYEQVIHKHADEGWRLSGTWSPPDVATAWIDLIFERDHA